MPHDTPQRRSIRLPAYDYRSPGAYFVTVVTSQRRTTLSTIVDKQVVLSELGRIVSEEWQTTAALRSNVELDQYVVMPNHVHAILWIVPDPEDGQGAQRRAATRAFGHALSGSLSTIINQFKATVTRRARREQGPTDLAVWQRGFHEHVIRNERSLTKIREYIANNPAAWDDDAENPANVKIASPCK